MEALDGIPEHIYLPIKRDKYAPRAMESSTTRLSPAG